MLYVFCLVNIKNFQEFTMARFLFGKVGVRGVGFKSFTAGDFHVIIMSDHYSLDS